MKRLLAVALVALVAASAASADSLPGTQEPNLTSPLLPQLLVPPANPVKLSYDQLLPIWQGAGQTYGIPWQVLAAINKVESNFGQNMGPSSAGAIGWMQFMPSTWQRWGVDADGDGVASPWDPTDAIYSAARYLAASGGSTDIRGAVFSYNHADWYVNEVMDLAQDFDAGGDAFASQLADAQQELAAARQAVVAAKKQLDGARQQVASLQQREAVFLAQAANAATLSDRLDAQKSATLTDFQVQSAQASVDSSRVALQNAETQLTSAQDSTSATAFQPGASQLLAAPSYSDGYVFPVGGGAGIVSVGHTHHDYPAADIDAPEGSPVYALSDAVVDRVWDTSSGGDCGNGFTLTTTDGLSWTYCHLAEIDPAVVAGAQLAAGQSVGLVGSTGDATGPHLHLQLQPATGYPQDEPWFESFAGTAFSWSDSVQSNAAQSVVFAVVGGSRSLASAAQPVIFFSTN
ncbi:MAG TPA: lytic murein transglycosylase [Gaiellaceae bacterium]|nr:lytic murein transglycosylase [Gaiellaceae bacterium]